MDWQREIVAGLDPARPVLLAGPTASGKSGLALAIAEAQGRAIVNADALQVYARWRVLTARPEPQDLARAPHHLYGHVGAAEDWSVGHWLRSLPPLLQAHPAPVVVGGTGLYFTALTEGLAEIPPVPAALRSASAARLAAVGLAGLLAELDPATRARIDPLNPARLRRAWEVLQATGRGLADWQADTALPLLPLTAAQPMVLEIPRDRLATRIDRRFDAMMAAGALAEAAANLPGWDPALPSARAIGAAELIAHLHGTLPLPEAVAAATTATRRYAKRQRTWARNRLGPWPRIAPPG